MNTYSQHGEDAYLLKLLAHRNDKDFPQVAIEIGACDGKHFSNAALFADMGWDVVFVEPLPVYFEQLQENYKDAENVICENAAISTESRKAVTFYYDQNSIDHSSLLGKESIHVEEISVKAMTYKGLLRKNKIKEVGILSIDAEGMDTEILKQVLASDVLPDIIIIESNTISERQEQLLTLAEKYHLINVFDVNTVWFRKDAWKTENTAFYTLKNIGE